MKTEHIETINSCDAYGHVSQKTSISKILFNILREDYQTSASLTSLREDFLSQGYVKLPGLLCPDAFAILDEEVNQMRGNAVDRSFIMHGVETPRELSTVGGSVIASKFPRWLALYAHHQIVKLLTVLTGGPIYACQHEEEFIVANFLNRQHGTHGWHLDDPAYALIVFFEAPPEGLGGSLEFITNWHAFCERRGADPETNVVPLVGQAREEDLILSRHHARGDAYLLRADKCLHRVTELKDAAFRRAAINMAYQQFPFQVYGESANALYTRPLAQAA